MRLLTTLFTIIALALAPGAALARNIVLTNDDGLTSNVVVLYKALKSQGHDVIVSVPCSNQSGMGAAVLFGRPLGPLKADCRNDAAKAGAPGAGAMTRPGLTQDFFYVDGTPVMALLFGIDVEAMRRWGKEPELVLSGPNEGQNVGAIVLSSGTVSNAQHAAMRGIPAIALSAGSETEGDGMLSNPASAEVARRSAELIAVLDGRSDGGPMLPAGIALNVNFPDELARAAWKVSRIGSYDAYSPRFRLDMAASASPEMLATAKEHGIDIPNLPGISVEKDEIAPAPEQMNDEALVYRSDIAVSPMQAGYDHGLAARDWLEWQIHPLLAGDHRQQD